MSRLPDPGKSIPSTRSRCGSPGSDSIVEPSLLGGLASQRLGLIKVPTLVVHHEKKECRHTLSRDVTPSSPPSASHAMS
jgi:hypothetical protein